MMLPVALPILRAGRAVNTRNSRMDSCVKLAVALPRTRSLLSSPSTRRLFEQLAAGRRMRGGRFGRGVGWPAGRHTRGQRGQVDGNGVHSRGNASISRWATTVEIIVGAGTAAGSVSRTTGCRRQWLRGASRMAAPRHRRLAARRLMGAPTKPSRCAEMLGRPGLQRADSVSALVVAHGVADDVRREVGRRRR